MKKIIGLCILLSPALFAETLNPGPVSPSAVVFNFDKDPVGQPPAAFTSVITNHGQGARWEIQSDRYPISPPNVLWQKGQAGGENAALLLYNGFLMQDGDVSVRFKIKANTDYQQIGIVYRYQNPAYYHIMILDAKENNCVLYQVKDGKKKKIDEKAGLVTAEVWHQARVVFRQQQYMLFLNGELAMADKDRTPQHKGHVGLATTGDTIAEFDNLTINP